MCRVDVTAFSTLCMCMHGHVCSCKLLRVPIILYVLGLVIVHNQPLSHYTV